MYMVGEMPVHSRREVNKINMWFSLKYQALVKIKKLSYFTYSESKIAKLENI